MYVNIPYLWQHFPICYFPQLTHIRNMRLSNSRFTHFELLPSTHEFEFRLHFCWCCCCCSMYTLFFWIYRLWVRIKPARVCLLHKNHQLRENREASSTTTKFLLIGRREYFLYYYGRGYIEKSKWYSPSVFHNKRKLFSISYDSVL